MPNRLEAIFRICLSPNIKVVNVSDSIYNLLGFNADDFISEKVTLQSRIHKHDQDIADELFSTASKSNSSIFNFRLRHADGLIRCIKGFYSKENHQGITTIDLLLQDAKGLWQQSNDQSTLPSNMVNFKAMMDNTDDYIYFKDRNHVFNGASQALVEITESTQHWTEFLGLTDYDVFLEEYADIYYSLEKQVFAGVRVAHEIQETRLKDGSKGWVDNRKYPIKNDSGEIIGLFGIARDITESKLAAEKTEQREHHLRTILESTSECVKLVSRDGTLRSMNSAGLALIEADRLESVANTSVYPIVAPEHRDAFQAFNESICDGNNDSMEFEIIGLNGTRRWMETTAVPFQTNSNGEVSQLAFTKDITERKKLELLKERYFRFFQLSTDPMCIADPNGCFQQVNPAFVKLLGFSEKELLEKPLIEFVLPDDREKTIAEFKAQIEIRRSVDFENRYICKDGSIKTLSWTAYFDSAEAVTYATAHDITNQKQAEFDLQRSEAQLHVLIHAIPDLIWLKDNNGVYLSCNPMFESFFGAKEKDIVGKTDYDFVDQNLADFFRENDRQAMLQKTPTVNEEWLTFSSNGYRGLFETIKTALFNNNGDLIGVLGISRNITERNEAEKNLRNTLVREVHHRIKNNLQGVAGLLRNTASSYPALKEPLISAIAQVHSIALIHGLQGKDATSSILLRDLVTEIAKNQESLWQASILVTLLNDMQHIRVLETETVPLALVLNELITNAVKHGEQDAGIKVELENHPNHIELTITNRGKLLPADSENYAPIAGTGLKLVKSLLPKKGVQLSWQQDGDYVTTALEITAPVITLTQ